MKKRFVYLLSLSGLLFSCGGGEPPHSHEYELVITHESERKTFLAGGEFDKTGLELTLKCKGCEEAKKVDFTVLDGTDLDLDQTSVTLAYETYRISYPIRVKEKFRIACIGDSLTEGHMWANQAYPVYLSRKVDSSFEVGNFGKNGISITGYGGSYDNPNMSYIKQEYYTNSIAFEPDILAIMLGTNDATGWAKAEPTFLTEYCKLLDSYEEALPYAKVIMMVSPPTKDGNMFGIPNETIKNSVNPIQRDLAEEYGYETLDLREEFEATENYESLYLRPNDGVHFTEAAADYVAGRVWDIASKIKF